MEHYDRLIQHPLIMSIFDPATQVQKETTSMKLFDLNEKSIRDLTEAEFYLAALGHCLANLLTSIEQLEETIFYMSNFSPSPSMKKAGITKASHLTWAVENYIVKTQSVYDRILVFIDRVFHLQTQGKFISHEFITSNSKISSTDIPKILKRLRKSLKKYYEDRNQIIHESSLKEDELHKIQGFSLLIKMREFTGLDQQNIKNIHDEYVRDYVAKKKREFKATNKRVCSMVEEIFDACNPIFERQKNRLS